MKQGFVGVQRLTWTAMDKTSKWPWIIATCRFKAAVQAPNFLVSKTWFKVFVFDREALLVRCKCVYLKYKFKNSIAHPLSAFVKVEWISFKLYVALASLKFDVCCIFFQKIFGDARTSKNILLSRGSYFKLMRSLLF